VGLVGLETGDRHPPYFAVIVEGIVDDGSFPIICWRKDVPETPRDRVEVCGLISFDIDTTQNIRDNTEHLMEFELAPSKIFQTKRRKNVCHCLSLLKFSVS